MKTRLSVNINKVALLRNSRGGNVPDLLQFARDCEVFGAEGITVHPRPDERHIRYSDVMPLKKLVKTEFNIEGNPTEEFIELVLNAKPDQVTLVPDAVHQLTSDHGWDTLTHETFLRDVTARFQAEGIRVSLFIDPEQALLEGAARTGADRIEFYTGPYAHDFDKDKAAAVKAYKEAALICADLGLGINAGHDLNLDNLKFFKDNCSGLLEVSIGHALIRDALYYGIKKTIGLYLRELA